MQSSRRILNESLLNDIINQLREEMNKMKAENILLRQEIDNVWEHMPQDCKKQCDNEFNNQNPVVSQSKYESEDKNREESTSSLTQHQDEGSTLSVYDAAEDEFSADQYEPNNEEDDTQCFDKRSLRNRVGSSKSEILRASEKRRWSASIVMSVIRNGVENVNDERVKVKNTETIHMFAISVSNAFTENPTVLNSIWAWILAMFSLFFVSMQIFVLFSLNYEAPAPTCSAQTDCLVGQFCSPSLSYGNVTSERDVPRCMDCKFLREERSEACARNETVMSWTLTRIDESALWYDEFKDPVIGTHLYDAERTSGDDIDFFHECLKWKHCELGKLATWEHEENTCVNIMLITNKMGLEQHIGFIFVLILFASILTCDIQEAQIEDALINFMIRSNLNTHPSLYILFIANRMRTYMLPLVTCVSGLSILLFEEMSTKNILLNLLAVLFICEGDNQLASLLIPPSWQALSNDLAESAEGDPNVKISFLSSRALVSLYFLMMMMLSMYVQDLMNRVAPDFGCAGFDKVQLVMTLVFAFFVIVLLSLWWTISSQNEEKTVTRKMLRGLEEFCKILVGLFITDFCHSVQKSLTFPGKMDWKKISMIFPIIPTVGIWIRLDNILKGHRYSLKHIPLDLLLGASWGATVYLFLSNGKSIHW